MSGRTASLPPRAYSFSTLSVFEECAARYGYKLQKKGQESSAPLDLGTASHDAISAYVSHCHREQIRADPDAVDPIVDGLTLDKKRPLPEPYRRDVRQVLADFAGSYVLDLVRPQVEVELAFDAGWGQVGWYSKPPDPPVRWRSKLDMIERPSVDRLVITDWKTGHYVPTRSELEAGDQLETYAFAASKKWPSVKTFEVRLYYVRQRWEHGPFEFSREDVADFGQVLERRMDVADREKKFAPVPGAHCQRCNWRRHCPGYQKAGMTATIPQDDSELAALWLLLVARKTDLEATVKERIKKGPLPTPLGLALGYVQTRAWGIDNVRGVVEDLVDGGVTMEAIWDKLTLSKTAMKQLLRGVGEEELVGSFLDIYGSAKIRNQLKEYEPKEDE